MIFSYTKYLSKSWARQFFQNFMFFYTMIARLWRRILHSTLRSNECKWINPRRINHSLQITTIFDLIISALKDWNYCSLMNENMYNGKYFVIILQSMICKMNWNIYVNVCIFYNNNIYYNKRTTYIYNIYYNTFW